VLLELVVTNVDLRLEDRCAPNGGNHDESHMIGTLSLIFRPFPDMVDGSPASEPSPVASTSDRRDAESSFELLRRVQAGDLVALNDLCARYLPRLRKWAHGRLPAWTRGSLDTQDLVQDTLTQVIQRIHAFEPRHEGALQAYLRQAVMNRIRDEIRRAERRPTMPLDSGNPAPDPSPLEQAIGQQALERYEAALQRLKPEDREAIILRIEMGCGYAEVAEALGKPSIPAAHMAVSRALVRLAKEMQHERGA
jgi:RNA polymerase sigma-70 factor, ECF subfamily